MSNFDPAMPRVQKRAMNLGNFLRQAARRLPERQAVVCGVRALTWNELDRRVDSLCSALSALGVRKGDRILVQAKNCIELIETMYASFRLGAVWVPTNFRQTPEEIAYMASSSNARAYIFQAEFAAHAAAVSNALSGKHLAIALDSPSSGIDYQQLVSSYLGKSVPEVRVDPSDPCWFFYTSGTTGRPKAAVLTHGQMGFVVTNHLCDLMPGTTEEDVSLVVAPLSHGAGVHLLTQIARGALTVLPSGDRFDGEEIWGLIDRHRVTNLFTVPTIVKLLVEHPAATRNSHDSIRYMIYAGAPMPRKDQKRALDVLGRVLVQYFGLGEVTGAISVLPGRLHELGDGAVPRLNTCGIERTGMQVSIQDDAGKELPPGSTGIIAVAGPAVFAGYYDNPEANEKAFRDGWFLTGDLGHMDEQGFLYITGRASDMYISGGSNIYPKEIEDSILQHPAIAEVCVVGVPDDTWGEVGIAVCIPVASPPALPEFRAWIEERIARYKIPRQIVFWDALPKSAYGKVPKKLVREELERRGIVSPHS